jgi:signal transduction histidine kinase
MASVLAAVVVGIVYFGVSVGLVWQTRGNLRRLPWLAVVPAFFIVIGFERVRAALEAESASFGPELLDGMATLLLVLMLVGLRRTQRNLGTLSDEATRAEQRYERALADYERLTRHRLANPLAAIRGGVATLREIKTLTDEERDALLQMVEKESVRLAKISLDPHHLSPEERKLRPLPGRDELSDAA